MNRLGHNSTDLPLLLDRFGIWVRTQPDKVAIRFLENGEQETSTITYYELDDRARAIAATLQLTLEKGDRAVLVFSSGVDFVAAFLGCLYAGIVAVPVYIPRPNRGMDRLDLIFADCKPKVVLTTADICALLAGGQEREGPLGVRTIAVDAVRIDFGEELIVQSIESRDLAFLQYTSGSTGSPKGVMVTQGNIAANLAMIERHLRFSPTDITVSWLPVFHDLGLIGAILEPLWSGGSIVLMTPTAFLECPRRWLQAISRYKGTMTGGPNFAFDLCSRKIDPQDRHDISLASLRVLYNGAEPVRDSTMKRFAETFSECGFDPSRFTICYGLAEATLVVSGSSFDDYPATVDMPSSTSGYEALRSKAPLVTCGVSSLQENLLIVDPTTLVRVENGIEGEVWISGPNVAAGYWGLQDLTEEAFGARPKDMLSGRFLRTGDLGFVNEGRLFVTGRLKDLIIINGRNHYPQDIELTIEESDYRVRPGSCVAFPIQDSDGEHLVALFEIDGMKHPDIDFATLFQRIQSATLREHGVQPRHLLALNPGSVSKTSSGKLQRSTNRRNFELGLLKPTASLPEGCVGHKNNIVDIQVKRSVALLEQVPTTMKNAITRKASQEAQKATTQATRNSQSLSTLPGIVPQRTEGRFSDREWETIAKNIAQWVAVDGSIDLELITPDSLLTDFGLDSITVVELATKISQHFGVNFPPSLILQEPTLRDLAKNVAEAVRHQVGHR